MVARVEPGHVHGQVIGLTPTVDEVDYLGGTGSQEWFLADTGQDWTGMDRKEQRKEWLLADRNGLHWYGKEGTETGMAPCRYRT